MTDEQILYDPTAEPRILASGDPIRPTDGHADNHNLREELLTAIIRRGVCDGPDDCRKVVREAARHTASPMTMPQPPVAARDTRPSVPAPHTYSQVARNVGPIALTKRQLLA